MQRYLAFISYKVRSTIQYRVEIVLWILLDYTPFLLLFFLFSSIFTSSNSVEHFSFTSIVEYYFLGSIIQGLTGAHFESWRSDEIRLGKIDFLLTRPFSYLGEIAWTHVAGKLFYFTVFFPITVGMFFLIQRVFSVQLFTQISLSNIPVFLALVLVAFVLQLYFGLLITILTFWFEGAQGLQHFKWIVITLLSGAMFPIELLPSWLQTIISILPFKYVYAVPIRTLQGAMTLSPLQILEVLGYGGAVISITHMIVARGIRRYGSVGG